MNKVFRVLYRRLLKPVISYLVGSKHKGGDKGLGGNTKDLGQFSPTQIRQAKDFIWKYMSQDNRQLIVGMATLSTHERHGLYVKQIFAELEADKKNGLIFHERMIIGFQYNHQSFPSEQTI